MPRHDRPIPVRLGRFNYWQYTWAHPPTAPAAPSTDRIGHAGIQKTFRQIRDDIGTPHAQRYRRHFEAELKRLGIDEPTPAIVALAYYLSTDRLSSQESEAQRLLAQQSAEIQDALHTWARGVWRRRTPGAWKTLLKTIARDQALFAEIVTLGPTRAGLVDTRKRPGTKLTADASPIWDRYDVSEAVAQRVYREYHAEMSALLGRGRRISENVRAFFRSQGIEAPRVRQTAIMPDLAGRSADEQVPIILHWFAHALRDLARYRDGHPPSPGIRRSVGRAVFRTSADGWHSPPTFFSRDYHCETPLCPHTRASTVIAAMSVYVLCAKTAAHIGTILSTVAR